MELNYKELEEVSEVLKAMAHPVRLCMVRGLLQNGKCNVTSMQNRLNLPQSTVSQHIQKLKQAGIIEGERSGLEINYSISEGRVKNLIMAILHEI